MDKYDHAIAAGQQALALATTCGALDVLVPAQTALTLAYLNVGGFREALDVARRAVALLTGNLRYAQFGRLAIQGVTSRGYVVASLAELEEMTEGRGVAEAALRLAEEAEHPYSMTVALWHIGLLGLRQRDVHTAIEANTIAGRLLDLSRTHTASGYQAHTYRLLGDVAIRREPPDINQATAYYRQALALADELGMRPLLAHCHLGLGRLYAKTGQREQARAAISAAIDLYRAMAMTFWLPQAEAALARVGGQ